MFYGSTDDYYNKKALYKKTIIQKLHDNYFNNKVFRSNIYCGSGRVLHKRIVDSNDSSGCVIINNPTPAEIAIHHNFNNIDYQKQNTDKVDVLCLIQLGHSYDVAKFKDVSVVSKIVLAINMFDCIVNLHKYKYIHNDINITNFVYDYSTFTASLVDFEFSICDTNIKYNNTFEIVNNAPRGLVNSPETLSKLINIISIINNIPKKPLDCINGMCITNVDSIVEAVKNGIGFNNHITPYNLRNTVYADIYMYGMTLITLFDINTNVDIIIKKMYETCCSDTISIANILSIMVEHGFDDIKTKALDDISSIIKHIYIKYKYGDTLPTIVPFNNIVGSGYESTVIIEQDARSDCEEGIS